MGIASKIKDKIINWKKGKDMPSIIETRGTFSSSDGKTDIHYMYMTPTSNPKITLQFLHGMGEHLDRYVDFGQYLANEGIAFFICDNLGHGDSSIDDEHLGYFGDWRYLVDDAKKLTDIAKETFPDAEFVLGGHSMGSFIVRAYLEKYREETKKVILIGTGNSNSKIKCGKPLAKIIGKFKGDTHRSQLLQVLSFGPYNKKIENPKTVFDWLSIDEDNVRDYMGDPLCGFTFTTDGFASISEMISFVTKKNTIAKYEKNISFLLLGGKEDPVSNYGNDIDNLAVKMKNLGIDKIHMKLYENMRHEILNEKEKEEVYEDILNWLKEKN